jgi:hypothetical protein
MSKDWLEAMEAVRPIASAIRWDCNLQQLYLMADDGFTDEAGVALAEALAVNKNLRCLILHTTVVDDKRNKSKLSAQSYVAFSATLRVNTNLVH